MKTLMLFLACVAFSGCTIHARPHIPSVVIDPGVEIEVRPNGRRVKCHNVTRMKCHTNRYGHRVCRKVTTRKCR